MKDEKTKKAEQERRGTSHLFHLVAGISGAARRLVLQLGAWGAAPLTRRWFYHESFIALILLRCPLPVARCPLC